MCIRDRLRCPIKVDGEAYYSSKKAPDLDEDTDRIKQEFELEKEGLA